MPVIEESGGFRCPDLDDDTDSYGTQDSGEFGTIPAEEGLLDDIKDDFSGRAGVMGDGYIDTDGTNLVYSEDTRERIAMLRTIAMDLGRLSGTRSKIDETIALQIDKVM